jgi:hypothetical protein
MYVADNFNRKPRPEVFLKTLARNLRRMGADFAPEKSGERTAERAE